MQQGGPFLRRRAKEGVMDDIDEDGFALQDIARTRPCPGLGVFHRRVQRPRIAKHGIRHVRCVCLQADDAPSRVTNCRGRYDRANNEDSLREWASSAAVGASERHQAPVKLVRSQVKSHDGVTYFAIDVTPHIGSSPWRVWRRYSEFRDFAQRLACAGMTEKLARTSGDTCGWLAKFTQAFVGNFPHHKLACSGAPFPATQNRSLQTSRVEQRRAGLETWLACMLGKLGFASGTPLCRDFVRHDSVFVKTSGRTGRLSYIDEYNKRFSHRVVFDDGTLDWFEAGALGTVPDFWHLWMVDVLCFLGTGRSYVPGNATCCKRQKASVKQLRYVEVALPSNIAVGEALEVITPDRRRRTIGVPHTSNPGTKLGLWYDEKASILAVSS
mmetsp:Transcript_47172/g.137197  ORF Transcript_47172/g.137197 Transcript_47172/m.137197 type:complete len:384 (-) Transcript_47172:8-1159(-)